MGSLCQAISIKIRTEGLELFETHRSSPTPLEQLLFYIFFLPFVYRKALLDACRIQESILRNDNLSRVFDALQPRSVSFSHKRQSYHVSPSDLAILFEHIYDSDLSCSLLSYFCRAESSPHLDEAQTIKTTGLWKELDAALNYRSSKQLLDYGKLIGGAPSTIWWSYDHQSADRTRFLFSAGIQRLKAQWSVSHGPIFLPYFNGKKNLGYSTQEAYYRALSYDPSHVPSNWEITSMDLLRWYYRTGNQILGPLEVRMKWGYNELKPRVYYALGGTAYWSGIYAQPIANELCKILPSTHPFSRNNIQRITPCSDNLRC